MRLSTDEVRKIARLARLHLSSDEEETFVPQLRQITDYFDQLAEVDVGAAEDPEVTTGLEADDVPAQSLDRKEFLDNAPRVRVPFLLVPQVKATPDE